jgi:hypothetical protein
MVHAKHKSIQIILLLAMTVTFLPSSGAASTTSNSIVSKGVLVYSPTVYVNLDRNTATGQNGFSCGFALAQEWKYWSTSAALQKLAKSAGFKIVRFISSNIEPCTTWNETAGNGIFDWTKVDALVQEILNIGAEPLVSLGFCDSSTIMIPPGMKSNYVTGLPNPQSYAAYCTEWIKHFKTAGFPVRFYEVFNEAWWYFYPPWTWNETRAGYFLQVFNACYNAMHNENPQIYVGNDASLHRKFLDYWLAHGGQLDMLSFHKYDCDGPGMGNQIPLQRAEQRYFVTDTLYYGVNDARKLWYNAHGVTLPAIGTEANWAATCTPGTDPRLQQVVGAVWTALMLRSSILNNVQYECYFSFSSSKSWEEANKPSGGFGFGMINLDEDEPWYPYYVQQMIGKNLSVGDNIISSNTSSDDIRSIAWTHGTALNILLVCKVDEPRTVLLQNLTGQLNFTKIDESKSYLTPELQTGKISASSNLVMNGYSVVLVQIGI